LIDLNLFHNPTIPYNLPPNQPVVQPNQQELPNQSGIINTQGPYNSPSHNDLYEVFLQLSLESQRQDLPYEEPDVTSNINNQDFLPSSSQPSRKIQPPK